MNSPLAAYKPWSTVEKIAFRFVFLFFLLFIIAFNNGAYPLFDVLMDGPLNMMHKLVPWLAKHVLHLPYEITVFTNGSGDTTYDYVCLLCVFTVSLLGCLIWTIMDRRRAHYHTLYYWLMVAVRFYVALMLVGYGFAKIFKTQFPSPGPARLTQPYGNSSPMGLAWTFLGFSAGYNLFMGIAEVAALLLLFRRTVTIGAIICLMTTANVMAVNYFYDVPVKIISTSLFVFSFFLLSPNFRPLFQFFFRGEMARLNLVAPPVYTKKWIRYALRIVKALVFVYVILGCYDSYTMLGEYGDYAPHPPLYGVYNVTSFTTSRNPSLIPDSLTWRQMIIQREGYVMIRTTSDTNFSYTFKPDTLRKEIVMGSVMDSTKTNKLYYEKNKGQLLLYGRLEGDSIQVKMRYADPKKYRLMSRGFHWISEYPYNR